MRNNRKDIMFGKPSKNEDPLIDIAIEKLLSEMNEYGPTSPEYPTWLDNLERLNAMKLNKPSWRPSPDQMFLVVGNILVALVVVAYEQNHVMVTRAKDFVLKK